MGIRIGDITSRFELMDRGEPRADRVSRRFVDQDEALRFLHRHLAGDDVKANVRRWSGGFGISHPSDRGFLLRLAVAITAGEVWVAELDRASTRHGGGGGGKTEPDEPAPSVGAKPKPKPVPKPVAPVVAAIAAKPAAAAAVPPLSPKCAELLDVLEKAQLSEHAEHKDNEEPKPAPKPFILLDNSIKDEKGKTEVERKLGIAAEALWPPDSTMRAEIFLDPRTDSYVVAFRGTKVWQDGVADVRQAFGTETKHYKQAIALAKAMQKATGGKVTFTGHSMGGGLASAAAVATGKTARTYNASGLHHATAAEEGKGYQDNLSNVDAYFVPGDPLSAIQDNRQKVFGAAISTIAALDPAYASYLATRHVTLDQSGNPTMPQAYGKRHALPVVVPEKKSLFDRLSPINKHYMDWVISGIEEEQKTAGCVPR